MVELAPNTQEYNRMNAEDVQFRDALVSRILADIPAWNTNRAQIAGERPKMKAADFSSRQLHQVDFSKCDLICAKFIKANLAGSNLRGADLRGADFTGAYLYGVDFSGANLLEARFDVATLDLAKLDETNLLDASLRNASLKGASLAGAFSFRAKFADANLEGATGFTPDNSLVRGAHIPLTSEDPWSILRRRYTGPRVLMNLTVILIAIFPFVVKAGFWSAINHAQMWGAQWTSEVASPALSNSLKCLNVECREVPLWRVTLGIDEGGLLWIAPLFLVAYNLVRLFVTYRVSFLRDSEERTGYTPRATVIHGGAFANVDPLPPTLGARIAARWRRTLLSYGWLYRIDRVLSWLLFVSVAALIWHVFVWLRMSIWLPA